MTSIPLSRSSLTSSDCGHNPSSKTIMKNPIDKVCIVGSGNWGSAIATIIGQNCARLDCYETDVNMWVFEEEVLYKKQIWKLSELLNTHHVNSKYLPGVWLPSNIFAQPSLEEACRDASLLIFVLPHQFLPKLLPRIRHIVQPSCRCVSLIKGLGRYTIILWHRSS